MVLTGISVSLRDQPSELIESRKALEAMSGPDRRDLGRQREAATERHTTTGSDGLLFLSLRVSGSSGLSNRMSVGGGLE